VLESTYKIHT